MLSSIKKIEDLSLNAWPSHQIQLYDGWLLRFSYFYTHRTNCVEQIGYSTIPLKEKIPYCEEIYRRWGTPCIFKISPIGSPDLDDYLAHKGYRIEHETTVMTRSLLDPSEFSGEIAVPGLKIENRVSESWLNALFTMKHITDLRHLRVVPQMYAAIPKDEIAVSVERDGRIIATGLGILDRDAVGVYAIHVDEAYRNQGIARSVVSSILYEGQKAGSESAYLQVVSDNTPAKHLYRTLGFDTAFRYWFRVQ